MAPEDRVKRGLVMSRDESIEELTVALSDRSSGVEKPPQRVYCTRTLSA